MFGNPKDFFRSIAELSNLKEGMEGVRKIVLEIFRRQEYKVSNKELAKIVQIPVPVLSAVRSELLKAGFLQTKSIISQKGLEWIKLELGFLYSYDFFEEFVSSKDFTLSEKYFEFFRPVLDFLEQRPHPNYQYDQSRSTPETVLKRALLMLKNGDVEGKRIVILGDDDGVSLALAYLRCAKEIFVIDIDSRILELIKAFAEEEDLENILHTQLWDIRTPFPQNWLKKYEVFETDPPYTVIGFKLFLNRATSLLNIEEGGKGYISFGNKTPYETWSCQQHLIESGFSLIEFIHNFNKYYGATILGNTSNMYVVAIVPQKIRIMESKYPETTIYTFDEVKTRDLPTVGYQIIAEFYGVQPEFLKNAELLKRILISGIEISGLHKEEIFVKEYSPFGLSIIVILVESHCHLHTWPEHNYLSLDLFVCDAKEKADKLFQYLLQMINPLDYNKFQFFRGKTPHSK